MGTVTRITSTVSSMTGFSAVDVSPKPQATANEISSQTWRSDIRVKSGMIPLVDIDQREHVIWN